MLIQGRGSIDPLTDILEGRVSPELILWGYRHGIFPMGREDGSIEWFYPSMRGIIPLNKIRVPKDVRGKIRRQSFRLTINQAFEAVIRLCAAREETWITDRIIDAYLTLHMMGYAHSIECWQKDVLVGGLYGVAIGGAFFGESMFHRIQGASKVALVGLIYHLRRQNFLLLDTQWLTPHLARFGGIEVPADEYMRLLRYALSRRRIFFNCIEIEPKGLVAFVDTIIASKRDSLAR